MRAESVTIASDLVHDIGFLGAAAAADDLELRQAVLEQLQEFVGEKRYAEVSFTFDLGE